MTLDVRFIGPIAYADALALQEALVEERRHDRIADTLLLVEHPPVFTLGRRTTRESLPIGSAVPIVEISRGGDITYHGPGQIVGYWIKRLDGVERDLHRHLRTIEERVIQSLAAFGAPGRREPEKTGVWVGPQKICSIGVAVRHWITFHGFALNLDVNPAIYREFRPCGLDGAVMTDLSSVIGRQVTWEEGARALSRAFLDPRPEAPA